MVAENGFSRITKWGYNQPMLTLNNAHLTVSVLDPVADQARFGARYCTGGYVFQVTDQHLGDLLSGPTFPHSFNWFDGQGLPESFRTHLLDPHNPSTPVAVGIGIGLIERAAERTAPKVIDFCIWQVEEQPGWLRFTTTQSHLSWSFELTRELRLINRTLVSETCLKNTGQGAVPVYWFPHPFFPHDTSGECCKCNIAVRMPENPGYELMPNGFIRQKNLPWDRRGYFQELDFDKGRPLLVLQKHPKLGLLATTCSYAPAYFPIWGNQSTFSFEPYFEQQISPGDESTWSVTYDF
jgi:hypothetical protein